MSENRRRIDAPVASLFAGLVIVLGASSLAATQGGDRQVALPLAHPLPPQTSLTPVLLPPAPPRPDYLVPTVDPVFGSTVTRVSDQRAFGTDSIVLRTSHPRQQPWNADGSLLLLGYTDPGYLLDGRSFAFTGVRLPHASRGMWSNVDPDLFVTVDRNRLLAVSAKTGGITVLQEFEGSTSVDMFRGESSPSNDDRSLVLRLRGPGGTSIVVFDVVDRKVVSALGLPAGADRRIAWAAASQSGQYVVLSWLDDGATRDTGVDLYDRNLEYVTHLYNVSEIADLGVDQKGADVLVTFDSVRGRAEGDVLPIVSVRLPDGVVTEHIRLDWVGNMISCRALDRPGWCYVSDSAVDAPRATTGGFDEIYALSLDGSETVQRFAHAHQSRGVPWDWSAHAVPSRDGTRVVWTSDWSRGRVSPGYAYVASYGGAKS